MNSSRAGDTGQSIVETVLLLPVILVLLAGTYWSYRHLSYIASAESTAMAQMIRSGRKLPGLEDRFARTIRPLDNGVSIRSTDRPLVEQVPLFRGMAGRTKASIEVSVPKDTVGGFIDLPWHDVRRESEGAVDCWGSGTSSGNISRRTVRGILISGAFR